MAEFVLATLGVFVLLLWITYNNFCGLVDPLFVFAKDNIPNKYIYSWLISLKSTWTFLLLLLLLRNAMVSLYTFFMEIPRRPKHYQDSTALIYVLYVKCVCFLQLFQPSSRDRDVRVLGIKILVVTRVRRSSLNLIYRCFPFVTKKIIESSSWDDVHCDGYVISNVVVVVTYLPYLTSIV